MDLAADVNETEIAAAAAALAADAEAAKREAAERAKEARLERFRARKVSLATACGLQETLSVLLLSEGCDHTPCGQLLEVLWLLASSRHHHWTPLTGSKNDSLLGLRCQTFRGGSCLGALVQFA